MATYGCETRGVVRVTVVEQHQPQRVVRTQVLRVSGEHTTEDLLCRGIVAFLLAVQRRDREVHLQVGSVGVRRGETLEHRARLREVELPHQSDAAVVEGDQIAVAGGAVGGPGAGEGRGHGHRERDRPARCVARTSHRATARRRSPSPAPAG